MRIPMSHACAIGSGLVFLLVYGLVIIFFNRCLITLTISTCQHLIISSWFVRQFRIDQRRGEILGNIQNNNAYVTYYPSIFSRENFLLGVLAVSIIWWLMIICCVYSPSLNYMDVLTESTAYDQLLACQVTIIGLFVPLIVSAVTGLLQNLGQGFFVNYFYKRIQFRYYLCSSVVLALLLLLHSFFSPCIGTLFVLWFSLNLVFSAWIVFLSVSLFIPSKLETFARQSIASELIEGLSLNTGAGP